MSQSLLKKYWAKGGLAKKYFNGADYDNPYSADDRLTAGERFYNDFMHSGLVRSAVRNYQMPKVDGTCGKDWGSGGTAERFRRAVKVINPLCVTVVSQIVLEEREIKAPSLLSTREKLYFNDEIKSLLCRGLDDLCTFYHHRKA